MSVWIHVQNRRWVRRDGAVVMWDNCSRSNLRRMWVAWEPDPSDKVVGYATGPYQRSKDGKAYRVTVRARFKTAKAAMERVDQLYPFEELEPRGKMATAATYRPRDYEKLSGREQWGIDKQLGILDWDGSPDK